MNKKTEKAIRDAIKKWEDIVAGTGHDAGIENCALCIEFTTPDCSGCPVWVKTGVSMCHHTPYNNWVEHQDANHPDILGNEEYGCYKVNCVKCQVLAEKELTFLKSLLIPYVEPSKERTNDE